MRLGFACHCETIKEEIIQENKKNGIKSNAMFLSLNVTNANKLSEKDLYNKLRYIGVENLYRTLKIIKFCVANNLKMYRYSSDLIPLSTHPINKWDWINDKDVLKIINQIKELVQQHDIRTSFHPSQYVNVNSPKEEVFQDSLKDLQYHNDLADMLGCDTLVLHVGGVYKGIYKDKEQSKQKFMDGFYRLPKDIQNKLVLENDDKSFNSDDVLDICQKLNIPFCVDLHHDRINPSYYSIENRLDEIINTWKGKTPKCHLSSGKTSDTDRSHADYITEEDYKWALDITRGKFDIMVEAKMKELAIFKLINK